VLAHYALGLASVVRVVHLQRSVGLTAMGLLAPFCCQNAVDATLGVFRGDGLYSHRFCCQSGAFTTLGSKNSKGLYLRYCPLLEFELAAVNVPLSQ
jgi:hypothetical protein